MNELNEIVGDDVNIAQEMPEEAAAVQAVAEENPAQPETPEQQAEAEQPRVVPLAALHEERARRKELAAELQATRQQQAQLEARVEARLAALQKAQEPEPPSFEDQPALHLKQQLDQVTQTLGAQQAQQQREAQYREQVSRVQHAAQLVQKAEAAFVAEKPDYMDAVNYVRDLRRQEFEAMGADPESAMKQATNEMIEGALGNVARGVNPSQLVYRMAELRGYKPKAVQTGDSQKFEAQAKGTAAARSLGGGGAATGQLNAQQLLAMSDDEFAEATKGGKWSKVMGG